MDDIRWTLLFIWNRRTRLLGYLQFLVASLAVADPAVITAAIGPKGLLWVLIVNGALTALVGHANARSAGHKH